MSKDFLTLLSFVLITNFTPGPNNMASASLGVLYGYRKTLVFMAGINTCFFMMMMASGWISTSLQQAFPVFEVVLRIIGAVYILWLAYHTFKASYNFEEGKQPKSGFRKGFFLQLFNVKVIIYALTLYSTFLGEISQNIFYLLLSALILTIVSFTANSTWTLFGAAIRTWLNRPWLKQAVNTVLALLLVYSAIELSDLPGLLFK